MVKKTKDAKTSKRRTQVKNLSKPGKSLTTAEIRNVKGGSAGPTTSAGATGGAGAGKIKFNEFTIK